MNPRSGPTERNLPRLVAAVPPAVLGILIYAWGVDLPYWDQWNLVPLIEDWQMGTADLADFWSLHADHRIVFPRLAMCVLARLSHWNIRWELAANGVLSAGLFFLTFRRIGRASRVSGPHHRWGRFLPAALALLIFNLNQWENWTWGLQMVVYFNTLAVLGGLVVLARGADDLRNLAAAAALGGVASFSFANGLLFWPLSLPLVLLPRPGRGWRSVAWVVLTTTIVGGYFHGYHLPDLGGATSVREVPGLVAYAAVFLGAPVCAYDGKAAGAGGLAALAAFAFLLVRLRSRWTSPDVLLWTLVAGYGAGSAVLSALGRLRFGLETAISSRYITIANLFWLGLLGLALIGLEDGPLRPAASRALRIAVAAVAVSLLASSIWGGVLFHRQYVERTAVRRALLAGDLDHDLSAVAAARIPPEYLDTLRRHRWSLFRDAPER